MNKLEILSRLNLGSSIAENDDNLPNYFIPTIALDDFVTDRYDIVRGTKGSGKSAILKVVSQQQENYSSLKDVILVIATEHTGEPSFKRAFSFINIEEVTEAKLVNAWKTYFLNLALDELDKFLPLSAVSDAIKFSEHCGLRYRTTSPYKKILWSLLRMLHIKSITISPQSIGAEFPDAPPDFWTKSEEVVDFPEALLLTTKAFESTGKRCWLLIDRLDATFQDNPELERLALRSLIIAYKDFMGQTTLRPKLFLRSDLFDTITSGAGFRELTHIMDRTSMPINWDTDKLLQMIMERFAFNKEVCNEYGFSKHDIQDLELRKTAFFSIFPNQIDSGARKADTWSWMCSRIKDGNNIRTPRDLHALVVNSANKQRDILALGAQQDTSELIGSSAVRSGLTQLSNDKIRIELIAEHPDLEPYIRTFEKQKAEQNDETLLKLFGKDWEKITERLVRIGFIEKTGETWKVPILYRDGLHITQGAAFPKELSNDDSENE